MYQIKNIETAEMQDCPVRPEWVQGIWECGSFRITDTTGTAYEVVEPAAVPPKVSPVEYKLLFTSAERIAIAAAKNGNGTNPPDPVLQDLYAILDDPRLTVVDLGLQSTQDALSYLETQGLIAAGRKAEILAGQIR